MRISGQCWIQWLSSLAVLILTALCCVVGKVDVEKRCETCKGLVKSFKEGLERTARYNFAGGDADWEEKKLGSYATSETRFIEIIETACKSSDYDCNRFLEAEEEILEDWWHNHHPDTDEDLEKWFCIDNVKVCCPENHYGPNCDECTGGIIRPCSGNGKCKGGGTRGGNGKCKCDGGYKGDLCDTCKKGFYEEMKNDTDIVCKACDTSCASTCSGPGAKACTKCKGGYLWNEENGCSDIDECKGENFPCQQGQFCENNEGSYKCEDCDYACKECLGKGADHCINCRDGFSMTENNECKDINECETGEVCVGEHMTCENAPGSFYCDCEEDYAYTGDACIDKSLYKNKTEGGETPNNAPKSNQEQVTNSDNSFSASQDGVTKVEEKTETKEETPQEQEKSEKIPHGIDIKTAETIADVNEGLPEGTDETKDQISEKIEENVKLKEEGTQSENNLSSSDVDRKTVEEPAIDDKNTAQVDNTAHAHPDL